ncbi:GTP-binding protein YPTM2, putative [Entamoeba invadens IP1]|uniref:GTP-binding protein YPTM2, putative n=1 Tax=Entamoeba invadens IP1 TaxID=370355 RepID=UPI0002C3EF9E|nr:GTP-binding protein YPTM2, putative [Entamoeba invadens IP1]ELP94051.1 GTP-binding protein YPTM2, putative [Entamoeba invadens IP1]|eukprot:XP_004260822.1 GTP-binding protein YPTM2, putative [Entamoeba invadens IP1]
MADSATSLKILLIGDSGVGKTALLRQYCDQKFIFDTTSTIGCDYRSKKISYKGETVTLQLWDTAGQERFRNITTSYYRGSQGVLIVYDTTNFDSLKQVSYWINELKKESVDGVVFLVGNKIDVTGELSKEQEDIVNSVKLQHFVVSAKSGNGVQEMFTQLVTTILDQGVLPEKVGDMQEVSLEQNKDNQTQQQEKQCC